MAYNILYHEGVGEKDVPLLPHNMRTRIARAIQERLTTHPEKYGQPLRHSLKGYWKCRVGDYRIVYKIVAKRVLILGIFHRRVVYERVLKRL